MSFNRRHVLKVSGLSLGGLMLGSSLALAGNNSELGDVIRSIIQEHYPKAKEHGKVVDAFIQDLLLNKVESLEPKGFLSQEMRKADRSDLERYVLIQFMTSPGFIAVQDN